MTETLPPGLTASTFQKALVAFRGVVGDKWVFSDEADQLLYRDGFQGAGQPVHLSAATVAPASTEEVQALVRLANEHHVPLWPISRGKNLGYGAAAPRVSGSVVVDLGRMNKILEVDVKRAYCVIEPGVGFYDLFRYLQKNQLPLWMSIPGNAWGSVVGNALERGMGMSPYGDHSAQICGMEVVLPTGEVIRTGNGAMTTSAIRHVAPNGFGPSWDSMFMQSNFGIVTQVGLWLMPEPESTLQAMVQLPVEEDLQWAIDVLAPLRLRRVIDHHVVIFNYLESAFLTTQRDEWYRGPGPMPESVILEIIRALGIGYWSAPLRLYGYEDVVGASARHIQRALAPHLKGDVIFQKWNRGEPIEKSAANIPNMVSMQSVNWYGGRGAHLGFSPLLPQDGAAALAHFKRSRARYMEAGLDYNTTFGIAPRFLVNINQMLYDRDDAGMCTSVGKLFVTLVEDARKQGCAEYRTHLDYMDLVASTFDYGDHALLQLNERIKDTLDPNGVIAPGKQGIWPQAYRLRAEANPAAESRGETA